MLKIELINPITRMGMDRMIQKILNVSYPDLLLINYGNHDFESLDVLKYCKEELMNIESVLLKFNKIAIVNIPPYKNESQNSEKLRFFYSEMKAKEWLLSRILL